MLKQCHRNLEDHCCHIEGQRCPHLEENTEEGFKWTCGLRKELGNWDLVHVDPRYTQNIQPVWIKLGIKDCGTYTCENCIDGNA